MKIIDADKLHYKQVYIDTEKGLTLAELDAEGKVKAEQLPDDVAYFEEGVDPTDPEYQDEYERILAKMYQELDNWDVMSQAARQATQRANQAAENAEAKGNKAKFLKGWLNRLNDCKFED